MPHDNRISREKFIAVIMRSKTLSDAARELGCTRQAVSLRLQRWRDKGLRGLPTFTKRMDLEQMQELVDKHQKGRK